MAAHKILIVDVQKVPNMAEPQAGNEHTTIWYQLDGNSTKSFNVTISGYPKTLAEVQAAVRQDADQRDTVVGQAFES